MNLPISPAAAPRPLRRLLPGWLAAAASIAAAACATSAPPKETAPTPAPTAPEPAPATRGPATVIGPDGLVLQTKPSEAIEAQDLPPPPLGR